MNIKRLSLAVVAVFAITFSLASFAGWWPFGTDKTQEVSSEVTELNWDDLIPKDFVQPENPFNTMTQEEVDKLLDGSDESNAELERLQAEFAYAPSVPELDGTRVRIPAYITPLEFDSPTSLKEFLLVPYMGACLHTPPPPSNQVIHAATAESTEFRGMYEPVWAVGTIRTETIQSDLAEAGYRLEVEELQPYE